jgi:RNA polymerase sigma factor (sigma-70 family)
VTTTTTKATTEAAAATNAERLRAGRPDPGAAGAYLGELFAEHGRTVLGLCRLLLRDSVEAEDATQQVFLSAHRSLLRGRYPRDEPAWLAAIARNECRARIRRRMREPLALPDLPDDLPDPLATAIRAVDLDALWIALSELPRRQRRAFLLRELGGLSYGELGAALGVTRPAVESLLFRARRQLRRVLAGANAALIPVALRDQLAQLVPGFGTASAASVPVAAKLAVVTGGVALTAAGAVALPHSHAHIVRTRDAVHVRRAPRRAPLAAPDTTAVTQPVLAVSHPHLAEKHDAQPEHSDEGQAVLSPSAPAEEAAPAVQRSEQDSSDSVDSGEPGSSDGGDAGSSSSSGD